MSGNFLLFWVNVEDNDAAEDQKEAVREAVLPDLSSDKIKYYWTLLAKIRGRGRGDDI